MTDRPACDESPATLTLEAVQKRITDALPEPPPGAPEDWWVSEAVRMCLRYRQAQEKKRIYDVSTVGARIRTAREIMGLTQIQLAGRLFPRRNKEGKLKRMVAWDVHGWETGRYDLPLEHLRPLCMSLGITKEWLLGDSEEGGPPMPKGLRRKQRLVNWAFESRKVKDRAAARAELERLRGLRPPKKPPKPVAE